MSEKPDLAGMIDHTYLKAVGGGDVIRELCREAHSHGFAAVMVHPSEIRRCRYFLQESNVKVGTVVGFPLGRNSVATKLFEARDALRQGAQELDMVLNLGFLQSGRVLRVKEELEGLARICRDAGAVSKLIIETCYLSDAEKELACQLVVECGIDFVKTSTGFGSGGATVADVRLLSQAVGGAAKVKASGGIRTREAALALVAAGASRLGTSSGVEIVGGRAAGG